MDRALFMARGNGVKSGGGIVSKSFVRFRQLQGSGTAALIDMRVFTILCVFFGDLLFLHVLPYKHFLGIGFMVTFSGQFCTK